MAENISNALTTAVNKVLTQGEALLDAAADLNSGGVAPLNNELQEIYTKGFYSVDGTVAAMAQSVADRCSLPVPALVADFVENRYLMGNPYITEDIDFGDMFVMRRNTEGTSWNTSGKLTTYPQDAIRFAYDPSSGKRLGILIEPSSTNIIEHSEDFTNWNTVSAEPLATSEVQDPAGGNGAYKLVSEAGSGQHAIRILSRELPGADSVTFSLFIKFGRTDLTAGMRLESIHGVTNGENTGYSVMIDSDMTIHWASPGTSIKTEKSKTGWIRLSMTVPVVGDLTLGQIKISLGGESGSIGTDNDGSEYVYIYGAQVESGMGTSYIATNGSGVTRSTDVLRTNRIFTCNPSEYCVYAEGVQNAEVGCLYTLKPSDSTESGGRVGTPTNNSRGMYYGGTSRALYDWPEVERGKWVKTALSTFDGLYYLAMNGKSRRTEGVLRTLAYAEMGSYSGDNNNMNGILGKFCIYNRQLTEAEVEEITR